MLSRLSCFDSIKTAYHAALIQALRVHTTAVKHFTGGRTSLSILHEHYVQDCLQLARRSGHVILGAMFVQQSLQLWRCHY